MTRSYPDALALSRRVLRILTKLNLMMGAFILALLIGIISGTYSSIFNASLILVSWENRDWQRWFGRGRQSAPGEAARTV